MCQDQEPTTGVDFSVPESTRVALNLGVEKFRMGDVRPHRFTMVGCREDHCCCCDSESPMVCPMVSHKPNPGSDFTTSVILSMIVNNSIIA